MASFSKPTSTQLVKILVPSLKNFGIGFFLGSFSAVYELISKWNRKDSFKNFIERLIPEALRSGSFVVLWVSVFNVIMYSLQLIRVNRKWASLLSGLLSGGFSMYITQAMSWRTTLYFLLRASYGLFRAEKISLPRWVRRTPSTVFYAFVSLILGYQVSYMTKYVDKSFALLLSDLSQATHDGYEFMYQHEEKELPRCHPRFHFGECREAIFYRALSCFGKLIVMNSSVHLISPLLTARFFLGPKEKRLYTLKRFFINVSRSTLFLWLQIMFCGAAPCIHKLVTEKNTKIPVFIIWFIGSFALQFEHPQRRPEIALFTLWRVLNCTVSRIMDVEYTQDYPEKFQVIFSTILFMLASGLWMYCLENSPRGLKTLDRSILRTLFAK